jgi:hypothetical protein
MLALLKQTMVVYKNEYNALLAKIPSLAAPLQALGNLSDKCSSDDLKAIKTSIEKACYDYDENLDSCLALCLPSDLRKKVRFDLPLPTPCLLYRYFMFISLLTNYRPPFVAKRLAICMSRLAVAAKKEVLSGNMSIERLTEAVSAQEKILKGVSISSFPIFGQALIDASLVNPEIYEESLRLERQKILLREPCFHAGFAQSAELTLLKGKSVRREIEKSVHRMSNQVFEKTLRDSGMIAPTEFFSDEEWAYLENEVPVEDPEVAEASERITDSLFPEGFLLGMLVWAIKGLVEMKEEDEKFSLTDHLRKNLETEPASAGPIRFPLTPVTFSIFLSLLRMATHKGDMKQPLGRTTGKGLWRLSPTKETLAFEPVSKIQLPVVFFGAPGYLRPKGEFESGLEPDPMTALADIFLDKPFSGFSLEGILLWLYMLELCLQENDDKEDNTRILSVERFLTLRGRKQRKKGKKNASGFRTEDYTRVYAQFEALVKVCYQTQDPPGHGGCFFLKERYEPVEMITASTNSYKWIRFGISKPFQNHLIGASCRLLFPVSFFATSPQREDRYLLSNFGKVRGWLTESWTTLPEGDHSVRYSKNYGFREIGFPSA